MDHDAPNPTTTTTTTTHLLSRYLDAYTSALAMMLESCDFVRHGTRVLQSSEVTIAVGEPGVRITFAAVGVAHGLGIIDLPTGTPKAVVETIARALHNHRAATP